jgi:uncharacterized protein YcfJ
MSTPEGALDLRRSAANSLKNRGSIRHVLFGAMDMKTMLKTSLATAASAALLGVAGPAAAVEYARVVSATPVSSSVAAPRQECTETAQVVQQAPSGAGAMIGAIAGGVIGNQFGHGFGRAAATGAGAVAGAAIGNNVEANANPPATVPVRQCRTVNGYENRVVGYDVVYEYHGQRYSTRLPNDPGQRLAVDIRPVNDAPLDRVGPPASTGAVPPAYAQAAPSYTQAAPSYNEAAPAYDVAPSYYAPAPVSYYAPAPAYYPAPYYVAPAAVGIGLGYWIGSTWHRGYHPGYRGRWSGGHRAWH